MMPRFVAFGVLALCLGSATAAAADPQTPAPSPTPVVLPSLPPNSQIAPYVQMGIDAITGLVKQHIDALRNSASGNVTYFKRFDMQVRTGPASFRSVHLHQGTVINPRGASIAPGQRVEVSGAAESDGSLDANTITIVR